ncbi:DUF6339 family protein [Sporolactobacillus sp. THM19-2]|uniref:DUF6339 family protein n=1 Tax=Sporolactobacillus sp. THM19-2 TaxID=2511171 RepID=UPI00101FE8CA|nr:DUF6339 family protein [Sporolactobacillus sp. THM19-2]RYL92395.1 hypothetical protein EWH91_07600 [Sporolactobacillus sp. THM19-2]
MSKNDARKKFNTWKQGEAPQPECTGDMMRLRSGLLQADIEANKYIDENESNSKKKEYLYDLRFGLGVYNLLNNEYDFKERQASNDEVWIYLSMNVVPDIVYHRWNLSETRYFSQSRRIWLKIIWWYVHLSWNGSNQDTYQLLNGFTTDEIVQLVERSGSSGYRLDVTREIMKQFSQLENRSNSLFRRVMKLNTARLKLVEPALVNGGIKKYVEELMHYFDEAKRSNKDSGSAKFVAGR